MLHYAMVLTFSRQLFWLSFDEGETFQTMPEPAVINVRLIHRLIIASQLDYLLRTVHLLDKRPHCIVINLFNIYAIAKYAKRCPKLTI